MALGLRTQPNRHNGQPLNLVLGGMRRLVALTVLLVPLLTMAEDAHWIQGAWVLDAQATLDLNPMYKNNTKEARNEALDMYYKLRFHFENGSLSMENMGYESVEVGYQLTKQDDSTYQLDILGDWDSTIIRTSVGFCRLHAFLENGPLDPRSLKCFRKEEAT